MSSSPRATSRRAGSLSALFAEESLRLRQLIDGLALGAADSVLDIGSSTLAYRHGTQPHIEANVFGPLRARGVEVRALDVRADEGVDYVCDLTAPGFDARRDIGRSFSLVLCNNVLVHLADVRAGAAALPPLVAPGGWLLVTTPQRYRRVRDPLDNGLRPSPRELARLVAGACQATTFDVVSHESVRIDEPAYYRRTLRPTFMRLGRLWVPLPGAAEQLRRALPALRWRVSCVLLRRRPQP